MSIAENIKDVRERIASACLKVNRNPQEVELVAVSKYVPLQRVVEAIDAGITIVGENRVQEAWRKYQEIQNRVRWHIIGHLQTNKVKRALQFAEMIQSVDSLHLAKEIQLQAGKQDRDVDVLIQVNTSGETSKFGFSPDEVVDAVGAILELDHLHVKGFMTIGAFSSDANVVRACFALLRKIKDELNQSSDGKKVFTELSMGMTNDFELAIEEGATMIRVGRLIFGERPSVSFT